MKKFIYSVWADMSFSFVCGLLLGVAGGAMLFGLSIYLKGDPYGQKLTEVEVVKAASCAKEDVGYAFGWNHDATYRLRLWDSKDDSFDVMVHFDMALDLEDMPPGGQLLGIVYDPSNPIMPPLLRGSTRIEKVSNSKKSEGKR